MSAVALSVFLVGVILVLATAVFVASPLFAPPPPMPDAEAPGERERWERQRRQALAAIKEVELDRQMGKLSDDDFARMQARFEAQALEAMAALEGKKSA